MSVIYMEGYYSNYLRLNESLREYIIIKVAEFNLRFTMEYKLFVK